MRYSPGVGRSSGEHTEQESSSKGAGERQVTGEGRGGERPERREERDAREGRPPGLARDRQGAHPAWARGPETNTEGSRDPMTSAVLTCVHAGRRVKKNKHSRDRNPHDRTHRGKGGGGRPTKKKPQCTAGGHTAQSKQAAGERVRAIGARDKKRSRRQATKGSKRQGGANIKDAGGPVGYKHG